MKKKLVFGTTAICILLFAACLGCQSTQQTAPQSTQQGSLGKVLILYYTWSVGNTENGAKIIQALTNADIVKLEPVTPFPELSYDDMLPWVKAEQEKKAIHEIKDLGVNPASYDFIFIGTPVWYGDVSLPTEALLLKTDFGGKPVAFFAMANSNEGPIMSNFESKVRNAQIKEGISFRMRDEKEMAPKLIRWVNSLQR
jgi:flavodoxin